MSLRALRIIEEATCLILRTEKHPLVKKLRAEGIAFESCDDIYDSADSFEEVYEKISYRILKLSEEKGNVVYAVPGHPFAAEKSVQLIIEKSEGIAEVQVEPAMSFIDVIASALEIDISSGLKIIDGLRLDVQKPDTSCGNIISQVYSELVASEIKLKLLDYYEYDQGICIIKAASVKNEEKIEWIKLKDLDRVLWIDYLTSIYIPPIVEGRKLRELEDLVSIIDVLRGENGCPWDKKQNHDTLKPYLLEECYELIDAIEDGDIDLLIEELGDVLLQVVLHSHIGKEEGIFDINDVIAKLIDKLIFRHPHVFGNVHTSKEDVASRNWEASKREEKSIKTYTEMLEKIPKAMSALTRSYKVQEKAALSGFDWDDISGAMGKVDEELLELKEAHNSTEKDKIEEEIGDLLFAIVNVARFLKVQPELCLKGTIEKFIKRFTFIEGTSTKQGKSMDTMTLEEMDFLWNQAKTHNFTKNDKN